MMGRGGYGGYGGGFGGMGFGGGPQFEKKNTVVEYPIEGLDMRPYVDSIKNAPNPVIYDLYAISNHYGSLNGGHYTATCMNVIDGKWYEFNDGFVSPCILSDNTRVGFKTWK